MYRYLFSGVLVFLAIAVIQPLEKKACTKVLKSCHCVFVASVSHTVHCDRCYRYIIILMTYLKDRIRIPKNLPVQFTLGKKPSYFYLNIWIIGTFRNE